MASNPVLPYVSQVITYEWRGLFGNAARNALHAEGFSHKVLEDDWQAQVNQHSLGWVCAREGRDLAGFVNVGWDGGVHAFILDTLVTGRVRGQGVGTRLIAVSAENARAADLGPILATEMRASKNSRSMALEKPK